MSDLISRQAAIDALRTCYDTETVTMDNGDEYINYGDAVGEIEQLPPAQPEQHIDEWCYSCKEYDKEKHSCPRWNKVIKNTVDELKSAQPEPCEDAVSRTEILRMINCINDHHAITPYKSVGAVTEHLTRIARSLPHVTPKQRTGHWIPVDSYTAYGGDEVTWMAHGNPVAFHYCSACKEHAYAGEDGDDILSNYCPHCGAKMMPRND